MIRRRSIGLSIVLVVATANVALAQEVKTVKLDGKALAQSIQEFIAEMRLNIEQDVAMWRERMKGMKEQIKGRLDGDEAARRRLLTEGSKESIKDFLAKGWDLVLDTAGVIKNVIDAKKIKTQDFFSDILGKDWSNFLPSSWLSESFNLDSLAKFDFESNFQDFLSSDAIHSITKPQSLGDVYDAMETATDAFCDKGGPSDHIKVPTGCVGPTVTLSFVPKTCIMKELDKQIVCDPAKLVLIKSPGTCALKHYEPFTWTGKSCKLHAKMGWKEDKIHVIGDEHDFYTIDLGQLELSKIKLDKSPSPSPPKMPIIKVVASQPLQRELSWQAPSDCSSCQYKTECISSDATSQVTETTSATQVTLTFLPGLRYTCTVTTVTAKGSSAPVEFTIPCNTQLPNAEITGDPAADGWIRIGRSNELGVWGRQSVESTFDVYFTSFVVTNAYSVGGGFNRGNTAAALKLGSFSEAAEGGAGVPVVGIGFKFVEGQALLTQGNMFPKVGKASLATFSAGTSVDPDTPGIVSGAASGLGGISSALAQDFTLAFEPYNRLFGTYQLVRGDGACATGVDECADNRFCCPYGASFRDTDKNELNAAPFHTNLPMRGYGVAGQSYEFLFKIDGGSGQAVFDDGWSFVLGVPNSNNAFTDVVGLDLPSACPL